MIKETQSVFLEGYREKTKRVLAEMAQRHAQTSRRGSVLFDKDEMLVDTIRRHVEFINLAGRMNASRYGVAFTPLSYEAVVAGGGSGIFNKAFGIPADRWEELHERERATRRVNSGAPTYTDNLQEIVRAIYDRSEVLGYMTATPIGVPDSRGRLYDTETYVKQDLFTRLGLPHEPTILRPADVPASQAGPWKLEMLEQIRAANPQIPVMLVDDSLSTAKLVAQVNSQRSPGEVPLVQIVMADGTLTRPKIDSGSFTAQPELGIYVAGWEELPAVIDQIQTQWHHQQ